MSAARLRQHLEEIVRERDKAHRALQEREAELARIQRIARVGDGWAVNPVHLPEFAERVSALKRITAGTLTALSAIHAAGTWIYMIRTVSPCW